MDILITAFPTLNGKKSFETLSSPQTNIYLIKSLIDKSGHKCTLIDPSEYLNCSHSNNLFLNIYNIMLPYITKADVICFSVNSFTWGITKEIVNIISTRYPNKKIILGGIHASYFDRYLLETNEIDYIVLNECENNLIELLNAIALNKTIDNIHGIAYMKDGVYFRTTVGGFSNTNTLNDLPLIDFSEVNINYGYSTLPIESSRGCYNRCAFCSINSKNNWRSIDSDIVIKRTKESVNLFGNKFTLKNVLFTDDCFTTNKERAIYIINSLTKSNKVYKYFFEARIIDLIDGEILSNIDKSYISHLQIGVDSGYDKGLKKIKKKINTKQINECLQTIEENNFMDKCFLSFIIGYPWEDINLINKTLDYIEEISNKYNILCNINYHLLFPSDIWENRYSYKINVDESYYDNPLWFIEKKGFKDSHPLLNDQDLISINARVNKMQKKGLKVILQSNFLN